MNQNCGNCRFYKPDEHSKDDPFGHCVRYPPHMRGLTPVTPRFWCGEWQSGNMHPDRVRERMLADVEGGRTAAAKAIIESAKSAFITCDSHGDGRGSVVISFPTLEEAQELYSVIATGKQSMSGPGE